MYFVYILKSLKDKRTYIGYTTNIKNRLKEHNSGKVLATKHRRPFEILLVEKCKSLQEAKKRERYWKSGAGRRNLKRIFQGFPPRFGKRGEARSK